MRIPRTALVLLACLIIIPSLVSAGGVYINSDLVTINSQSTVADARYRLSNTGWDMGIRNSDIAAGQVVNGIGNVANLTGDVYNFVLEHDATKGLKFTLTGVSPTTGNYVAAWGDWGLVSAGSTQQKTTLSGFGPNSKAFNLLDITVQASVPVSMSYSGLTFSGLSVLDGTLDATATAQNTGPTIVTQQIYSDSNMALLNWTLSGRVTGVKTGTGCDECLKFNVGLKQVTASVVPEPGFYGALALGLSGLYIAVRRKRA